MADKSNILKKEGHPNYRFDGQVRYLESDRVTIIFQLIDLSCFININNYLIIVPVNFDFLNYKGV